MAEGAIGYIPRTLTPLKYNLPLSTLFWIGYSVLIFILPSGAEAARIKVACIDCYSSPSLLPKVAQREFPDTEIEWVLVQTHPYSADQARYLEAFPASSTRLTFDATSAGWADQAVAELRKIGVTQVIGGMDEGSFQAPLICEKMGLPHNSLDPILRESRRLKDLQMSLAGKFSIPTRKLDDVDAVLNWVSSFPHKEIVVKFNQGVSGHGMEIFSKADPQLREKLQAKLNGPKMGPFGKEDYFIVQPRIEGRKFFINTFSSAGTTVVTGLSEYFMMDWNGTTLYLVDPFLSLTSAEAKILTPAALEVSRRMKVTIGSQHLEFVIDFYTGEIYLLENNVRMAGAGVPSLEWEIYGMGQLELSLFSILDPARLQRELSLYPRVRKNAGLIAVIPSAYAGTLNPNSVREIESLPSYYLPGPQYKIQPGSRVEATANQNTAAALLHFRGSPIQIKKDLEAVLGLLLGGQLVSPPQFDSNCSLALSRMGQSISNTLENFDWSKLIGE